MCRPDAVPSKEGNRMALTRKGDEKIEKEMKKAILLQLPFQIVYGLREIELALWNARA
jgi:threonyl-tRNA synthetase